MGGRDLECSLHAPETTAWSSHFLHRTRVNATETDLRAKVHEEGDTSSVVTVGGIGTDINGIKSYDIVNICISIRKNVRIPLGTSLGICTVC
jgi:hypothetical protein